MAVEAYAALVSLMNVLNRIQYYCPVSFHPLQIQSLFDQINSLVNFLEAHSQIVTNDLAKKMVAAAFSAEDTIESYIVDRLTQSDIAGQRTQSNTVRQRSQSNTVRRLTCWRTTRESTTESDEGSTIESEEGHAVLCYDLDNAQQEIDLIHEEAMEVKEMRSSNDHLPRSVVPIGLSVPSSHDTIKTKGYDDIVRRLTFWRTTPESTIESDAGSTIESDEGYALLCSDMENALQEMDLILQEAMDVKDNSSTIDQLPISVVPVGLAVPSNETIKAEGFDEQVKQLIGQLKKREPSRQILPIVGMGGIGKTTLAKSVCKYPALKDHFDIIAWVTVSQVYTTATIIRLLLRDIIGEEVDVVKDEKLEDTLYKRLCKTRYLIILDDIWEVEAWYAIRRFLPDNNNRSRILLTTRRLDVARGVGSCDAYVMKLLDDDKSWDLLSKMVFGQEVFPLELEDCGKKISKSCKGLPLTLVVIGGLLKMSESTLKYWEYVARNISSIISGEENERCLEILSLSYHHLPIHLKPCFLYMATYPEDHRIKVSDVIKLWAADGFLKPVTDKLPEEIAKKYINDLIDRNLITMSYKRDTFGVEERLTVHDLVRELSIREAKKGGFVHVNGASVETIGNQRREFSQLRKGSVRSLICFSTLYLQNDASCSRLLRVFFAPYGEKLPGDIMQAVNLRFLRCRANSFPLGLLSSSLWDLETLIVDGCRGVTLLPCDIWKLRHMKHLSVSYPSTIILPDPPSSEFVLEKLETLEWVQDLSDKVVKSIPNIKHLKIDNSRAGKRVPIPNMVRCHKLETLEIIAPRIKLKSHQMFPDSIRELSLWMCEIPWGSMTLIGSLPNLQILKLYFDGFKGEEWTTSEGEFQSLKYLSINNCDLVRWRTEEEEECSHHFPTLEHLYLLDIKKLEEIPEEVFKGSMTLQSIELCGCKDSVVRSAKRILEEQINGANDQFTLQIDGNPYSRSHDEEGEEDEGDEDNEEEGDEALDRPVWPIRLFDMLPRLFRTMKHLRPTWWRRNGENR